MYCYKYISERGVFTMRKIYISTAAAFLAASVGMVSVFAAAGSSITVKSDKSEVSYTYKADDGNEAKADASKLFGGFRGVSKDEYSSESFTITSKTQNGTNVDVFLVVEAENTDEVYSPLDYYSFVITAADGDVIYDSAEEEMTDPAAVSKEIPFGRFNTQFTTDTKKYTVDYKINGDIAAKLDEETISGISVSIVSRAIPAEKTAADTGEEASEGTEAEADPTYTVEVKAENEPENPEEVVAAATTAAAAEEYELEATETESAEIKKVCGVDIPAGRYLVSGNGIVTIESATGELKGEATLTDGTVEGVEGVEVAVATITEGDIITAIPLPGQEKPAIKFEKANTGTQATATAASQGSNGSSGRTSSAAGAARATAAPSPASAAAKSNPKTGEDSPAIAWLCGLMAAAAVGIGALELIKRKKA